MKKVNAIVAALLLSSVLVFGANMQSYAENQASVPMPGAGQTENAPVAEVELKAPINVELTEEEKAKAAEEARLKEELTNEQKQIGEAAPLRVEDKDFDPNANEELTKEVIPNTGMELIKLISMFARVMLAVLVASFVIYFLLLFVRKYFHPPLPAKGEEDFDIRDLNSPKTTDEALKSFLDRTGE